MATKGGSAILGLFGATLLLSAALLFIIEPLIAKMLLPLLGGSPGVWNTCMVFFQATLLIAYLYADVISHRLNARQQALLHVIILACAFAVLPVHISSSAAPPVDANPIPWLLFTLTLVVGLPFFAVSTTAPLLQKWFSDLRLTSSRDPYFLYAASNLGSLIGLLSYPFLIEPQLSLKAQALDWRIAFGVLLIMVAGCAALRVRSGGESAPSKSASDPGSAASQAAPTQHDRVLWIIYAAIPSSLVLGLTTFVTSSLAATPLLWIIPLAIYLLSLILAFAGLPKIVVTILERVTPWVVLCDLILLTSRGINHGPASVLTGIGLDLTALLCASTLLHARVVASRPATRYLTQYYLLFSLGGVLGSMLNAFIAPFIFNSPLEFPLVLGATGILVLKENPFKNSPLPKWPVLTWLVPLGVATMAFFLFSDPSRAHWLLPTSGNSVPRMMFEQGWRFGLPLILCIFLSTNLMQFRWGLCALLLVAVIVGDQDKDLVFRARNFFGVSAVRIDRQGNQVELWHGGTEHGSQSLDPELRGLPRSYYTVYGPIGKVLLSLYGEREPGSAEPGSAGSQPAIEKPSLKQEPTRSPYAVVGLGPGTLSWYAHPKQSVYLYDINPNVVALANNPFYFTYLYEARKRGSDVHVVEGDARLEIQKAPDHSFGIIILDAFSADSIPVHLLTREAMEIYKSKLTPDGIIAVHASSKYYDMVSAVWNVAQADHLNTLICYGDYTDIRLPGKIGSLWILLSDNKAALDKLKMMPTWMDKPLKFDASLPVWTDDYCNSLAYIKTHDIVVFSKNDRVIMPGEQNLSPFSR